MNAQQYSKNFGHWHIKMDFLIREIEKLKKQGGVTVQISAFLLEGELSFVHSCKKSDLQINFWQIARFFRRQLF